MPHGIDLYKGEYLYIINHSLTKEHGERVELVKIHNSPLSMEYVKSFVLPSSFIGTLNSIAAIDEENFFFSTYKTNTVLESSNKIVDSIKQIYAKYIRFFQILLNIKSTHLYHYNKGTIKIVDNTKGIVDNGIAYNEKRRILYFAQTLEKKLFEYKVQNDNETITLLKTINLDYAIDNIFYDTKTEILSIGVIGKIINYAKFGAKSLDSDTVEYDEVYGGLVELDTKNNDTITLVNMIKGELRGISSAYRFNNSIYYISPEEKGLLICDI